MTTVSRPSINAAKTTHVRITNRGPCQVLKTYTFHGGHGCKAATPMKGVFAFPFFWPLRLVCMDCFFEGTCEVVPSVFQIILALNLTIDNAGVESARFCALRTVSGDRWRPYSISFLRFRTSPSNAHRSRSMYSPGGDSSIPFSISCGP